MSTETKPKEYEIDGIKIIEALPPMYEDIIKAGMRPSMNAYYTYDGAIYNPAGGYIPDDILAHEKVHIKQQKEIGSDEWWERFIDDQYFRIEQEVEGYAAQYRFMCNKQKDRNHHDKILRHYAGVLAGPTYGNVIGGMKAMQMIRSKANVR